MHTRCGGRLGGARTWVGDHWPAVLTWPDVIRVYSTEAVPRRIRQRAPCEGIFCQTLKRFCDNALWTMHLSPCIIFFTAQVWWKFVKVSRISSTPTLYCKSNKDTFDTQGRRKTPTTKNADLWLLFATRNNVWLNREMEIESKNHNITVAYGLNLKNKLTTSQRIGDFDKHNVNRKEMPMPEEGYK